MRPQNRAPVRRLSSRSNRGVSASHAGQHTDSTSRFIRPEQGPRESGTSDDQVGIVARTRDAPATRAGDAPPAVRTPAPPPGRSLPVHRPLPPRRRRDGAASSAGPHARRPRVRAEDGRPVPVLRRRRSGAAREERPVREALGLPRSASAHLERLEPIWGEHRDEDRVRPRDHAAARRLPSRPPGGEGARLVAGPPLPCDQIVRDRGVPEAGG